MKKPKAATLAHTWATFIKGSTIGSIKERPIAKTTDLLVRLRNAVSVSLGHDQQTRRGRPAGARFGKGGTYEEGVSFEVVRKASNARSLDTSRVFLAALILSKRRRGTTPIEVDRLDVPAYTIHASKPASTRPTGSIEIAPQMTGSPLLKTINGGPSRYTY